MCSSSESIALVVVVEEVGCFGDVESDVVVEVVDPKVMGGMPEGTVKVKSIALFAMYSRTGCWAGCKVCLCACFVEGLE